MVARTNLSFALLLAGAALAGACAGADAPADNVTSSPALSETTNAQALCVQSFQKQRECSETFLPALVDARVRFDKPAGIAEMDRKEGREALVAVAREEWKNDSTDEAIAETCTGMVAHGGAKPEMVSAMQTCLAAGSCGDFVPCQVKIIEAHLSR
jgi:hypothetical protein